MPQRISRRYVANFRAPPPTPPPRYVPPRSPVTIDNSGRSLGAIGTRTRVLKHRSRPTESARQNGSVRIMECPQADYEQEDLDSILDSSDAEASRFEKAVLDAVFPSMPTTPQPSDAPVDASGACDGALHSSPIRKASIQPSSRRVSALSCHSETERALTPPPRQRSSLHTDPIPRLDATASYRCPKPALSRAAIPADDVSNPKTTRMGRRMGIAATEEATAAFISAHASGKDVSHAEKLESRLDTLRVRSLEEFERMLDQRIGAADSKSRPSVQALRLALKGKLDRVIDVFHKMDTDGSGAIDRNEFETGLLSIIGHGTTTAPWSRRDTDTLFDVFDKNGDGTISYDELYAGLSVTKASRIYLDALLAGERTPPSTPKLPNDLKRYRSEVGSGCKPTSDQPHVVSSAPALLPCTGTLRSPVLPLTLARYTLPHAKERRLTSPRVGAPLSTLSPPCALLR